MSDDLDKLLKSLLGNDGEEKDDDDDDALPEKDQKALLEGLMEKPINFKVGDYVKRNKFGKKRYQWPKDDEVAMITEVYPPGMRDGEDDVVHGEMTTVKSRNGKPALVAASINFRYYDVVSAAPKIRTEDEDD